MSITIKHSKSNNVIPIKSKKCRASRIDTIFSHDTWKDKTCFLLGGGPSLTGFDFAQIKNNPSIGVNKAFTKFPTTINYAMDVRFYDMVTYAPEPRWKSLHQQWIDYKGIKLFVRRSVKFIFDESVYYISNLSEKGLSLDLKKGIWPGNNSGFGALMVACCLGCKRIGLLGYDLKVQSGSGRVGDIITHWHGGYGLEKKANFQSNLDKFKLCFEEFSSVIAQQGIEVVNLSKDSALTCFPKDSLKNFLG